MDARTIIENHAGERIALIAESHRRVTGRELVPAGSDIAEAMWNLPAVVLAHGMEGDPLFFYGNRAALELFEFAAEDFIRMPSRFSAEPLGRKERARLLANVTARGFIENYAGIRIANSGKRFQIAQAIVWNLIDHNHVRHGQAATFSRWVPVN